MKKNLASFLFPFSLILVFLVIPVKVPFLFINPTDSAPHGLYIRVPGKIMKGDWVNVDIREKDYLVKSKYLLKEVKGIPGDSFNSTEEGLILNDQIIKRVDGIPFSFKSSGILGSGQYIVINDMDDSYDSRYFGIVTQKMIKKVKPLLLWE